MMKNKSIILLIIIALIIIAVLLYNQQRSTKVTKGPVEATGLISAIEVEISPEIQEKIEWLCCNEGDKVKKGDILVRLYDRKLVARVNEAKAVLAGAEARRHEALANLENSKARVDSARAIVRAAQAEIDRISALNEDAKENFNRISELFNEGYATRRDLDAAKTEFDAATAQLNAAVSKKTSEEAFLSRADAEVKSSEAQVSSAMASIEEARARLLLTETILKDSVISSPIDGVITYKAFEAGENALTGKSIYTIHDLRTIWARVDIEETDIGRIKLDSKAEISADSLPGRIYEGEVREIGIEAEFATQRDVSRGRQDIKTFRVKVGILKPDGLLKPGMTVKVNIKLYNEGN